MHYPPNEPITFSRDCDAVIIPSGDEVRLSEGVSGFLTQALGGSFSVYIEGNLFRIAGVDADAIGKIPEVQPWLEEKENDGHVDEKAVWGAMKTCYDPEIPVNIVDLGLIYSCEISNEDGVGASVAIKMTLTAPGCGMGDMIATEVRQKIEGIQGTSDVNVELVWDPPWDQSMITESARLQLGML